jgi:hypothetical protein
VVPVVLGLQRVNSIRFNKSSVRTWSEAAALSDRTTAAHIRLAATANCPAHPQGLKAAPPDTMLEIASLERSRNSRSKFEIRTERSALELSLSSSRIHSYGFVFDFPDSCFESTPAARTMVHLVDFPVAFLANFLASVNER